MPDVDADKIPVTTYTFVDMAQIAIESLGTILQKPKPMVHKFESEVCSVASKVLAHELIHASIEMEPGVKLTDELVQSEESHIEDTLAKMKVPPRLINARLNKSKSIDSYKQLMTAIYVHRT